MVDGVTTVIVISGLLLGCFSLLMALLNRPPGIWQLMGLAVIEVVLVVQAVAAVGKILIGERPDQLATFVGYFLTALLVPPLGALLSWAQQTRWGSTLIAGAGLVVSLAAIRLHQVWHY